MKTKAFHLTNYLVVLAFAVLTSISFTACSDDDKPSIDELLSDKTTPVTFEIGRSGDFLLFDYAGSNYVGSHIIHQYYYNSSSPKTTELNLRQGRHHLIWLRVSEDAAKDTTFDPANKTISTPNPESMSYAEYDYEVTDYIAPAHKPNFMPLTTGIKIIVTDHSEEVEKPANPVLVWHESTTIRIGEMKGFPFVTYLSLHGGDYKITDNKAGRIDATYYVKNYTEVTVAYYETILCPEDGIDSIQLQADVKGADGSPVYTTTLPKFSVKRGYTTVLRGPLFSGNTSDWTVTMEPYSE